MKTFRYKGGKGSANTPYLISERFNTSFDRLVETFCGSAKVSVHHRHTHGTEIWLNDLWTPPISWFQMIRDDVDKFQKMAHWKWEDICHHPDRAYEYYKAHFDAIDEMETEEQALHFYIISRMAWMGNLYSGGFCAGFLARDVHKMIDELSELSDVLQGQRITNLDYREVLRATNGDDLVYCDPPYAGVQKDGNDKLYRKWKLDVNKLLDAASDAPCKTVISYDIVPDDLDMYDDVWNVECIDIWHASTYKFGEEILIKNF